MCEYFGESEPASFCSGDVPVFQEVVQMPVARIELPTFCSDPVPVVFRFFKKIVQMPVVRIEPPTFCSDTVPVVFRCFFHCPGGHRNRVRGHR